MRRILGVTGIRSDYDIQSSVFRALAAMPGIELQLAVAGAHLSRRHGHTIDEIRLDGFAIADEIPCLLADDTGAGRVKGLAAEIAGLTQTVQRLRPDIIVVLGDREDAMAAALVAAYTGTCLAHLCGGDVAIGNVDDQVRHAVSKLAHLHFTTNAEASARLERMGEQAWRIHTAGNPGLDRLLAEPEIPWATMSAAAGVELKPGEPYLLVIQHVLSSEHEHGYAQMRATIDALERLAMPAVIIHPNSDAGSEGILRAIGEARRLPRVASAANLPRPAFVNLMRRAACLVGNSSAGILESPVLRLPVVNCGNRQRGRLHAANVQFTAHDPAEIAAAIQRAVADPAWRARLATLDNPYGDGRSGPRIAQVLAEVPIDARLLIKEHTY